MSFQWLVVPLFLSFLTIRTSSLHLSLNPARRATTELSNHHELGFSTTILVGGEDFAVMVDLDSSDLWVAGEVVRSEDTASTSTVQYGSNTVPGSIRIAKLEFMDIDIDTQAFLQVDDDSFKVSGVLGIGPGLNSSIYNSSQSSAGLSVMDHIFLGKSRIRKYLTLLWERGEDPKDRIPGDLTIGELLEEYEDVDAMPKIPITSGEHLQILLDEDGVVGPDSQPIPLGLPPAQKQAKVILTSLTPFNKVPSAVAEAIYSKANGAELANVTVDGIGEVWLVPCHLEINVTLNLHGESYPLHPWDTVMPPELLVVHADQVTGASGERLCLGSFQPLHPNQYQYDISLGWSFLRNVYTVIGFGDELRLENGSVTHREPYVKMLSVTKANKAHEQFAAFLNAEDDPESKSPHGEHGTSASGGSEPQEKGDEVEGQSTTGAVLGIAVTTFGLVIVVAVFTLWLSKQDFCRRHRKQHHNAASKSQINMESFGKPPHIVHIPGHPPPSPHKNGSLRGRDLV